MGVFKPTIDDAIASVTKAAAKLEAVIKSAGEEAERARTEIARLNADMTVAQDDIARASRIKKKLEELVS